MINMQVFQYSYTTDAEGRGPSHKSIYFKNRRICEHAAKGVSSWGSDGNVYPTIIQIDESETIEEYEKENLERERLNILNKLTPRERELLGV